MALDGTLIFGTSIDESGFEKGVSSLTVAAGTAIGNIAANMVSQISNAVAQIPAQMVSVGSSFEASMSQVAATMGITSAAAEFKTLSDAAKEMGESTKFSASQAGEALNYLALAGYDAEKAVSALPTVLNVAAAGGMELADASDMITDAMSALGLETSQMANFADKLAVTAQKSNTSVAAVGTAIGFWVADMKKATAATNEYSEAMSQVQENSKHFVDDSETEIALLKKKVDRYEELRSDLDNLNQNEMAEFLDLADELKEKLPEGTELIDEQTGAYLSLAGSIDAVIEKMRIQAVLNSKQDAYALSCEVGLQGWKI